jgi:hypothetical protein
MLLTLNQLQARLSQLTYRPGWNMRIYEGATEGLIFELTATIPDNFEKDKDFKFEVRSPLPPMVSIQSFDLWISWRLRRIEIHESLENLKCNGEPLINPHRPNADTDIL